MGEAVHATLIVIGCPEISGVIMSEGVGVTTLDPSYLLAGGKNMGVKHGTYTVFDERHSPMSNLFVSMLNKAGVKTDQFADSTDGLGLSVLRGLAGLIADAKPGS